MCLQLLVLLSSVVLMLLSTIFLYKEMKVSNLQLAIKLNDTFTIIDELESSIFSNMPYFENYQYMEQYLPRLLREFSTREKYKLFNYATFFDNNTVLELLIEKDIVDYTNSYDYFMNTINYDNKNSIKLMLANNKFTLDNVAIPFVISGDLEMLELFVNNNRTTSEVLINAVEIALYNNRFDIIKYILMSDKMNLSYMGKYILKNITYNEPNLQKKLEIMKLLLTNDKVLKSLDKEELEHYFRLLNKYQC
jgi:hypothetical protein